MTEPKLRAHNRDGWPHWQRPTAAVALGLAISLALLWMAGADRVVGQTTFFISRPLNLYEGQTIGQTLPLPADGLHRLDVMFTTYREIREGALIVRISDEQATILFTEEVDSGLLRETWHSVTFPPLTGIAGRTLRLELDRPASWRSPIGVRAGPGAEFSGTGLINGVPDPSFDLPVRAYMAVPASLPARIDRVLELAQALTARRPGLFGQPAILLLIATIYAAGLGLLAIFVAAPPGRS